MKGNVMKQVILGFCLSVGTTVAFAHGCPGEMKKIDDKLPSAKVSQAQMSKVKELRSKGEQLHKEGKHTESMNALGEAKKILGI
jgi:hypothetical protein